MSAYYFRFRPIANGGAVKFSRSDEYPSGFLLIRRTAASEACVRSACNCCSQSHSNKKKEKGHQCFVCVLMISVLCFHFGIQVRFKGMTHTCESTNNLRRPRGSAAGFCRAGSGRRRAGAAPARHRRGTGAARRERATRRAGSAWGELHSSLLI